MDIINKPDNFSREIHDENFELETTVKKKRIAIIGGGLAGMGSIINLKDEGLEPVCFEYRDAPGGTWYYSHEPLEDGYASTMWTTVLNNSKEMSALSMHPPRKEYNVYMRHDEAYQYYMECLKNYDVEKHFRCNTEVIGVKKAEDYEESGRFIVTVKNKNNGEIESDIYDGVMVCTGHFSLRNMVNFKGQEQFKGKIIHTHDLKNAENFKGQRVLVIGNGCSGLDAADLLSTVAKKVYLSSRSGMFVISRLGPRGYPTDYVLLRKYIFLMRQRFPNLLSWLLENIFLDTKFDRSFYAVPPRFHALSKDPVINDIIFTKLLSGTVVMKSVVNFFTENGVMFDEDENITEIDSVVLATGYKWSYPFLEDGLLQTENGRINLYKCIFPVQLPHPTLAFIGLINPFGPGIPIGELQIRWVVQLLAGKGRLPSQKIMLEDVIKRHQRNLELYSPSNFISVQVDNIPYSDDIASQFGVKPNLLKYFFTDFSLFLKLVFGPFLPYQYRLQGPHRWDGAREAIMTADERIMWSLARGKRVDRRSTFEKISAWFVSLIPKDLFLF